MTMQFSCVASVLVAGTLLSAVQEPERRAEVATIAVTVTGRGGEYPKGLNKPDFRVLEEGREQTIVSVSEGPGPVSIGIVLDSSDIMLGTRQRLGEQSVEHIVAGLTPEEEACLVMYRRQIIVAVPWTRGPSFPKVDWTSWQTMPFSEVLNGIRTALFLMDGAAHPRRAVVAVSSTDEVASAFQLRQFVVSRAQSETSIYGLRTDDYAEARIMSPNPYQQRGQLVSFEDLVRDSGGRVLPVNTTDSARRSPDALVEELRHQYVLRFMTSKPFDGSYRRLKVELRNRKDLRVRHRSGYLARAASS